MSTRKRSNTKANWSMGASLGAAVFASACCTIPLALVSVGIGGAWLGNLTALEPYRWIFVSIALAALGYAGWREWQMSCRPDCDCETSLPLAVRRFLMGAGALAILALIASPWVIAPSPGAATQQVQAVAPQEAGVAQGSAAPTSFQQVVLTVDGMTCSACTITVRKALEGVEGVYTARATYEPPEVVVRFDPAKTSVDALTQATKNVGYPSQLQTASP